MRDTRKIGGTDKALFFTVILGINEIASAVAVRLHRLGHAVVLAHDPVPPVIRRKMAFHDALFDEAVTLEGISARRIDSTMEIRAALAYPDGVIVTELGLLDLMVIRRPDVLVDARMQKSQITPDLRCLAGVAIGLGPAFWGGGNCDVAIETRPGKAGRPITSGPTDPDDGIPRRLGERGAERFVYSAMPGLWHTAIEIGTRVFKDFPVGYLGGQPVCAPFDGVLRGVVRDGTEIPAGVKVLEIDPRGRQANVIGPDGRAKAIAKGVIDALAGAGWIGTRSGRRILHLVK